MNYKLINKLTGEEHICQKVIIDGFDYYVSDEEYVENELLYCVANGWLQRARVEHLVEQRGEDNQWKKVIATNNPNIDIPQILEKPNETLIHQIAADLGYRMLPDDLEEGIKAGYKESQETHPFSEEDMIEFAKFSIKNNFCKEENRYYQYWELLQLWKEQKPKTLYYV